MAWPGLKSKCRSTNAKSLAHSKLFHGASNSRKNEELSAKNGILWENTVSYRTTKFSLPPKAMDLYFPLTFTQSLSCLWLQKTEHLFVVVKEFIILGVCYILHYNKSWHCFVFWEEGIETARSYPLVHPWNACNGQGWVRSGTESEMQARSPMWEAGTQVLEPADSQGMYWQDAGIRNQSQVLNSAAEPRG